MNTSDAQPQLISDLPDWLPPDAWAEFVAMRKRIKMPLSEYGKKLAIRKLDTFRADGQDIQAVLDEAIFREWTGLWPLRKEAPAAPAAKPFTPQVVQDQWWRSNSGIERRGRELGIGPKASETYDSYRDRLFEAQKMPRQA